jgi:hypothetical protein
MSFVEMIEKIDREHNESHKRLKAICKESERLDYDSLISKVKLIVGDIEGYKFDTFVNMLAEELEHSKIVNNGCWDMTEEQVIAKYDDDMNYWKENYEKYGDKDLYKDVEEFKESMLDWFLTYSLDGAFASVECEYKYRKSLGLC